MRYALVTGAGVRVGRMISEWALCEGYHLAIHCHRSLKPARELVREALAMGLRAEVFSADLSDANQTARCVQDVLAWSGGRLSLLVNSAAYWPDEANIAAKHDFHNEDVATWDMTLALNVRAAFFLTQGFAPALSSAEDGVVVNISDTATVTPFRSRASYTISRHALEAVTAFSADALPKVRVYTLRFGKILPPNGMSLTQQEKFLWLGKEAVTQGMRRVVRGGLETGSLITIAEAADLSDECGTP